MDWTLAITRNRDALRRIVAVLFAMISATTATGHKADGKAPFFLPRHVYSAILAVLRPAESALRRLIAIAAKDLAPKPQPLRPLPTLSALATAGSSPRFRLFDPLKEPQNEDESAASMLTFEHGFNDEVSGLHHQQPDEPVNATLLFARLRALRHALNSIPRQASRFARWTLKRDAALKAGRPTRISIMRMGLPPGWRQRPIHEIDTVLRECHRLARDKMNST
ncbi:MAG: hypothetical protein ACRCU5_14660 [Rhizobiaceae bacterium]